MSYLRDKESDFVFDTIAQKISWMSPENLSKEDQTYNWHCMNYLDRWEQPLKKSCLKQKGDVLTYKDRYLSVEIEPKKRVRFYADEKRLERDLKMKECLKYVGACAALMAGVAFMGGWIHHVNKKTDYLMHHYSHEDLVADIDELKQHEMDGSLTMDELKGKAEWLNHYIEIHNKNKLCPGIKKYVPGEMEK